MRSPAILLSVLPLLFSGQMPSRAQEGSPGGMVRTWTDGMVSPKATMDDVRWMEGKWEGRLEGAMQQYVALTPVSGHMPGFARAWGPDGKIWFYEINDFVEANGSVEFHVKHFSGEFSPWEGKDGFLRHRLIAMTDNALYFDGITMVKDGPEHQTVYVRITDGERKGQIVVVHQTRVPTP